jgi:hypothetical protein
MHNMPEQHRVAEIRKVLERRPSLQKNLVQFGIGECVLTEGTPNRCLYAMLKGRVVLRKRSGEGRADARPLTQAGRSARAPFVLHPGDQLHDRARHRAARGAPVRPRRVRAAPQV